METATMAPQKKGVLYKVQLRMLVQNGNIENRKAKVFIKIAGRRLSLSSHSFRFLYSSFLLPLPPFFPRFLFIFSCAFLSFVSKLLFVLLFLTFPFDLLFTFHFSPWKSFECFLFIRKLFFNSSTTSIFLTRFIPFCGLLFTFY